MFILKVNPVTTLTTVTKFTNLQRSRLRVQENSDLLVQGHHVQARPINSGKI